MQVRISETIKAAIAVVILAFCVGFLAVGEVKAAEQDKVIKTYDVTIDYLQTKSIKELEVIKEYSDNTHPRIFPIITGTVMGVGALGALTTAGASVPLVVAGVASNTAVGYFAGYGWQKFIDAKVITPNMLERKKELQRELEEKQKCLKQAYLGV